ncbi:MAG: NUDIX domain-containing protein [Candidatus Saccharimonadales bacterium]
MSIHATQTSILRTLRRNQLARFGDLMRPSGMSSDTFKFHIKKLVELGYIHKTPQGAYALTPAGKEFANNLDELSGEARKQPKISLLLQVGSPDTSNPQKFLFQQRRRNPFYGYWGNISGPAKWGQTFEKTAAYELQKQTGLTANFQVKKFIRARDFMANNEELLEDKLFVVLSATTVQGTPSNGWGGGHNAWMTLSEFNQQKQHFTAAEQTLQNKQPYASRDSVYDLAAY